MKELNAMHTLLILPAALLVISFSAAQAQTPEKESSVSQPAAAPNDDEKEKSSPLTFTAQSDAEYCDNIYELTDSQIDTYNEKDPDNVTNKRYDNMESLSDWIIAPRLGVNLRTKSPFGGKLRAAAQLKYNWFIENAKSRYAEGKLKIEQSAGKNGSLVLDMSATWGFFKKNYFSGLASGASGSISKSERIYSPATYDEYEGTLGYEHRLIRKKDELAVTDFTLRPYAGYRTRLFNVSFGNRNLDVAEGGLLSEIEFLSRFRIAAEYTFEREFSPAKKEAVLFDETSYGADVNGDGSYYSNAYLITKIDRSCIRNAIEFRPSAKITDNWTLFAAYRFRRTAYTSDNRLDLDHYSMSKNSHRVKAGTKYEFTSALSAQLEWVYTNEEDDDGGKFTQNRCSASVKYVF